jgi:hypothetical protein
MPELIEPEPEPIDPVPGAVEGEVGPMPVALFMLLGPLTEDGEPAELCMPEPLLRLMGDALPVVVAWDGLALAGDVIDVDGGALVEPPLMPAPDAPAPVPMVWADAAAAVRANAALAIIRTFIAASFS